MLNIPLQMLSKRKKNKKRKSKTVKKASNSGVSDTTAEPGEADNYVEHPTSDGEQKKETKKRKSKIAKQAPPVEVMKDFFQQEFNKIWDSLNHVQKAIADLPKNTNTAQMSATIKVSAENKSQASTCDKQEEKTAEGKNKVRQTKSTKITDYFHKVTCPSKEVETLKKQLEKSQKNVRRLQEENMQLMNKNKEATLKEEIETLKKQLDKCQENAKKLSEENTQLLNKNKQLQESSQKSQKPAKQESSTTMEQRSTCSSTKEHSKPKVFITGDSLTKDLHGWMMSRTKQVKVHTFPGATTTDMQDFLIPLIKKEPREILLHIGTNDLRSSTPQEVFSNINGLVKMVTSKGIKCSVSGIIVRNDSYSSKGQEVNRLLKVNIPQDVYYLDNNNITVDHLNYGGLHFNRRGTGKFAYNLVNYVKSLDFRPKFS